MTHAQSSERAGAVVGSQQATPVRSVAIRLVTAESEASCRFWIGLAARGGVTPTALLAESKVDELLQNAALRGVSEEPPLLLADTQLVPPRFVFLQAVPADDFRARTIWTQDLIRSLRTWTPKSVGLYLAPELLQAQQAQELLAATLHELVDSALVDEIYLLAGGYGVNALLNAALRLKAELDAEQVSLRVYH